MIKCNFCPNTLSAKEVGDITLAFKYKNSGHKFMCDSCIDTILKGESDEQVSAR